MSRRIEKAAVLGAGIMGSGIAAHLANCGVKTYLLDIVPPELTADDKKAGLTEKSPVFRNRFATTGLANAIKNRKPIPAFYHDRYADADRVGNFEDDLGQAQGLRLGRRGDHREARDQAGAVREAREVVRPGAIVASNTSGLPIADMIAGPQRGRSASTSS